MTNMSTADPRLDALLMVHGDANGVARALLAELDAAHRQLAEARARLPREGSTILDPEGRRGVAEVPGPRHAGGRPEGARRAARGPAKPREVSMAGATRPEIDAIGAAAGR